MALSPTAAAHLADSILVLHVGIAVFVVAMSLAVPLGGVRHGAGSGVAVRVCCMPGWSR